MILAILYVEIAGNSTTAAHELEHKSLMTCKQLVRQFGANEMVVRVECNDPESLNQAIADFAGINGVQRITTCVVARS